MMWIVKIALRAPYTFTVLGVLLLIGGALSTLQMAKDIFPAINIPVVGIIWTYNGLPSQEMAERITTVSERALTTSVNNIEHIESNSFNGIAVIKVYLQPQSSVDAAIAETTAECQTILKTLPPGMTPPNILSYNAANVPVLQLSVVGQSSPSSNSTISQPTLFVLSWQPCKAHPSHCLMAARPGPYRWISNQTSCKLTT